MSIKEHSMLPTQHQNFLEEFCESKKTESVKRNKAEAIKVDFLSNRPSPVCYFESHDYTLIMNDVSLSGLWLHSIEILIGVLSILVFIHLLLKSTRAAMMSMAQYNYEAVSAMQLIYFQTLETDSHFGGCI